MRPTSFLANITLFYVPFSAAMAIGAGGTSSSFSLAPRDGEALSVRDAMTISFAKRASPSPTSEHGPSLCPGQGPHMPFSSQRWGACATNPDHLACPYCLVGQLMSEEKTCLTSGCYETLKLPIKYHTACVKEHCTLPHTSVTPDQAASDSISPSPCPGKGPHTQSLERWGACEDNPGHLACPGCLQDQMMVHEPQKKTCLTPGCGKPLDFPIKYHTGCVGEHCRLPHQPPKSG